MQIESDEIQKYLDDRKREAVTIDPRLCGRNPSYAFLTDSRIGD